MSAIMPASSGFSLVRHLLLVVLGRVGAFAVVEYLKAQTVRPGCAPRKRSRPRARGIWGAFRALKPVYAAPVR